jgi:hypothetical protein
MAGFNGSGTFVRSHDFTTDLSNTVPVTASRMDTEHDGFATGLSSVICKDGQTTTTARIPFAAGISVVTAGVLFPASQSASSDVNCLDDYEEASANATVTAGTGTFTSVAAVVQYTKVGRNVAWSAIVTITTAGTAAGALYLPLSYAPGSAASCAGIEYNATKYAVVGSVYDSSGGQAEIYKYDGTTIIADGRTLHVSGTFRV